MANQKKKETPWGEDILDTDPQATLVEQIRNIDLSSCLFFFFLNISGMSSVLKQI